MRRAGASGTAAAAHARQGAVGRLRRPRRATDPPARAPGPSAAPRGGCLHARRPIESEGPPAGAPVRARGACSRGRNASRSRPPRPPSAPPLGRGRPGGREPSRLPRPECHVGRYGPRARLERSIATRWVRHEPPRRGGPLVTVCLHPPWGDGAGPRSRDARRRGRGPSAPHGGEGGGGGGWGTTDEGGLRASHPMCCPDSPASRRARGGVRGPGQGASPVAAPLTWRCVDLPACAVLFVAAQISPDRTPHPTPATRRPGPHVRPRRSRVVSSEMTPLRGTPA
jgi:hypothetical protein